MNIIVCNNPDKRVYSESYDKVIYLGYTPNQELKENEIIIIDYKNIINIDNFKISLSGICKGDRLSESKYDLQDNASCDQIVLNNNKYNICDKSKNGYTIYYVGQNNHYEIEI